MSHPPQTEQEALYEDIPRIAAQIHRVALILSDYPREIGGLVIKASLKRSALKGNRRNKLAGLLGSEADAIRDQRRNAAAADTTAQPERNPA